MLIPVMHRSFKKKKRDRKKREKVAEPEKEKKKKKTDKIRKNFRKWDDVNEIDVPRKTSMIIYADSYHARR